MKTNLLSHFDMARLVKRVVAVLFLLFILFSVKSFGNTSELSLRMFDNSFFLLEIDNAHYGMSNGYTIPDLAPGNHRIKVMKVGGKHGRRMVYNGFVYIPSFTRVVAEITPYRQFNVISQIALGRPCPPVIDHHPVVINEHRCSYMSPGEFQQLRYTIANIAFDDSKLNVAKQAISSKRISSGQVLELMKQMTFESTRLELAKYAYFYVYDRQDFYVVNQAFVFASSIDHLSRFIQANS